MFLSSRIAGRLLAAVLIAVLCTAIGMALWAVSDRVAPVRMLDHVFYDAWYHARPVERQADGPVVIVAVDDYSIEAVDRTLKFGWPWPREFWGLMVRYLEQAGAKAAAFDLLFDRSSVYNASSDDDNQFAEAVNGARLPVVLATIARSDSTVWELAPPIQRKTIGVANISGEDVVRTYNPVVRGHDSLALAALKAGGHAPPEWARGPFLLHYFGPHARGDQPATFKYIRAASLLAAARDPKSAASVGIAPEMFRGKTVLLATITAATYDLKSSPLSPRYPGVEFHATALADMLAGRHVLPAGFASTAAILLAVSLVGALGVVLPARVGLKIAAGLVAPALLLGVSLLLFRGQQIRWLAPAGPLAGAAACSFAAMGYSYLTELRRRRFVLKALAQYVSREVADEISRDPAKLSLGGQRREMTVMFTDLANFTTLSEKIPPERLEQMLNAYLQEMSTVILDHNGTVDKYIGDAIMCFWNAPASQPEHALLACRAALGMQARENALQESLSALAGAPVRSRTGINSGPMIVGNMGSSLKFAYTVLGDAVNLASRLEGANKLYNTRILLSENTATFVRNRFALRRVDLLKVKGKTRPMAVYEPMAEGEPDAKTADLIRRYERAFALYQQRDFAAARDLLEQVKQDFPHDGPTATLIKRVSRLIDNPPGPDWDGVYEAREK